MHQHLHWIVQRVEQFPFYSLKIGGSVRIEDPGFQPRNNNFVFIASLYVDGCYRIYFHTGEGRQGIQTEQCIGLNRLTERNSDRIATVDSIRDDIAIGDHPPFPERQFTEEYFTVAVCSAQPFQFRQQDRGVNDRRGILQIDRANPA